jgi:hypothetical protein
MITVKTMKQIATSRSIPSFRAVSSTMGIDNRTMDRGRVVTGYSQMVNHETRRQIRNRMWQR